jgi:magnesium-transporting ATPase (P-type)
MRFPMRFPRAANESPRLFLLQSAQLGTAGLAVLTFIITFLLPFRHKLFTLSLLYTPLLTSIPVVFFIARERKHAAAGTLSKQRYAKYQVLKMLAAIGMSIVGFIGYLASAPAEADQDKHSGEQGMWLNGVKIGKWQSLLLWINFCNWYVPFL